MKITLHFGRTNPPEPHALTLSEENQLKKFRALIQLFKLADIPLSYGYSKPDSDALIGVLKDTPEQMTIVEKHGVIERGPVVDRLKKLVEDLGELTHDRDRLVIDKTGRLKDCDSSLRHAPLSTWYSALAALGPERDGKCSSVGVAYFPFQICVGVEKIRIRLLPLEELRARCNQLRSGDWPTDETPTRSETDPSEGDASPDREKVSGRPQKNAMKAVSGTIAEVVTVVVDAAGNAYRLPMDALSDNVGHIVSGRIRSQSVNKFYDCREGGVVVNCSLFDDDSDEDN